MGWPGTSCDGTSPNSSCAAITTDSLTLATSVIVTSGESSSTHCFKTSGTLSVGTPITTISPADNSLATSTKSPAQRSTMPLLRAISKVDLRLEIPITSLAIFLSRTAAAKLEPISPIPMITNRLTTFSVFFLAINLPDCP